MNALPPPRVCDFGEIVSCNAMIEALHGRLWRESLVEASGCGAPERLALLLDLSFEGSTFSAGFESLPFGDQVQALCAPWSLGDLPPSLSRAAVSHLSAEMLKGTGADLSLKGFRLNAPPPEEVGFIHGAFAIRSGGEVQARVHIFAEAGFDFAGLGRGLGLGKAAARFPPRLEASLDLGIGAAHLSAEEARGIAAGDVIFIA